MALQTAYRLVFAEQRVLGLGMIEILADGLQRHALPAAGVVAGLARLFAEAALVRIGVAIIAFPECQADVARFIVRSWSVALLASHLGVQPGQRKTRF